MIIIIVLILAVISGIFMYNKFQQQELKQLTEEAFRLFTYISSYLITQFFRLQ